jgi:hypothetical protein
VDEPPPVGAVIVFNELNDRANVLSSSVEIRLDVLILDTERLDIATIDPNIVDAVKLDTTVFDPNAVDTFNVEPCRVLTVIVLAVITFPIIVEKAI